MWDVRYAETELGKSFGIALAISVLVLQGFSYFLKRGKFDSGRDWLYRTREQALANWWLEKRWQTAQHSTQHPVPAIVSVTRFITETGGKYIRTTIITISDGAPESDIRRDVRTLFGQNPETQKVVGDWLTDPNRKDGDELYPPKS
jgi:hypothetical protein